MSRQADTTPQASFALRTLDRRMGRAYRRAGGEPNAPCFLVQAGVGAIAGAQVGRDLARRSQLVAMHYQFMTWSYVGLCAAAVSEIATRLPAFRFAPGAGAMFGIAVGVATIAVMAIGGRLIVSRRSRTLAPF